MDVTIARGVVWQDDLRNVEPDLWPELVGEYRQFCRRNLPTDCRSLLRMITEGEHAGWANYGNRDRYIRDGLGLDPDAVDWALLGLRIAGADVPLAFQQAQNIGQRSQMLAASDDVLPLPPKEATGRGHKTISIRNSLPKPGTSATYVIAKLKRDAPGFAKRLAAGEFKSARAAALAAGIIKETPPLTKLRRDWKKASDEERATFLAEVVQ